MSISGFLVLDSASVSSSVLANSDEEADGAQSPYVFLHSSAQADRHDRAQPAGFLAATRVGGLSPARTPSPHRQCVHGDGTGVSGHGDGADGTNAEPQQPYDPATSLFDPDSRRADSILHSGGVWPLGGVCKAPAPAAGTQPEAIPDPRVGPPLLHDPSSPVSTEGAAPAPSPSLLPSLLPCAATVAPVGWFRSPAASMGGAGGGAVVADAVSSSIIWAASAAAALTAESATVLPPGQQEPEATKNMPPADSGAGSRSGSGSGSRGGRRVHGVEEACGAADGDVGRPECGVEGQAEEWLGEEDGDGDGDGGALGVLGALDDASLRSIPPALLQLLQQLEEERDELAGRLLESDAELSTLRASYQQLSQSHASSQTWLNQLLTQQLELAEERRQRRGTGKRGRGRSGHGQQRAAGALAACEAGSPEEVRPGMGTKDGAKEQERAMAGEWPEEQEEVEDEMTGETTLEAKVDDAEAEVEEEGGGSARGQPTVAAAAQCDANGTGADAGGRALPAAATAEPASHFAMEPLPLSEIASAAAVEEPVQGRPANDDNGGDGVDGGCVSGGDVAAANTAAASALAAAAAATRAWAVAEVDDATAPAAAGCGPESRGQADGAVAEVLSGGSDGDGSGVGSSADAAGGSDDGRVPLPTQIKAEAPGPEAVWEVVVQQVEPTARSPRAAARAAAAGGGRAAGWTLEAVPEVDDEEEEGNGATATALSGGDGLRQRRQQQQCDQRRQRGRQEQEHSGGQVSSAAGPPSSRCARGTAPLGPGSLAAPRHRAGAAAAAAAGALPLPVFALGLLAVVLLLSVGGGLLLLRGAPRAAGLQVVGPERGIVLGAAFQPTPPSVLGSMAAVGYDGGGAGTVGGAARDILDVSASLSEAKEPSLELGTVMFFYDDPQPHQQQVLQEQQSDQQGPEPSQQQQQQPLGPEPSMSAAGAHEEGLSHGPRRGEPSSRVAGDAPAARGGRLVPGVGGSGPSRSEQMEALAPAAGEAFGAPGMNGSRVEAAEAPPRGGLPAVSATSAAASTTASAAAAGDAAASANALTAGAAAAAAASAASAAAAAAARAVAAARAAAAHTAAAAAAAAATSAAAAKAGDGAAAAAGRKGCDQPAAAVSEVGAALGPRNGGVVDHPPPSPPLPASSLSQPPAAGLVAAIGPRAAPPPQPACIALGRLFEALCAEATGGSADPDLHPDAVPERSQRPHRRPTRGPHPGGGRKSTSSGSAGDPETACQALAAARALPPGALQPRAAAVRDAMAGLEERWRQFVLEMKAAAEPPSPPGRWRDDGRQRRHRQGGGSDGGGGADPRADEASVVATQVVASWAASHWMPRLQRLVRSVVDDDELPESMAAAHKMVALASRLCSETGYDLTNLTAPLQRRLDAAVRDMAAVAVVHVDASYSGGAAAVEEELEAAGRCMGWMAARVGEEEEAAACRWECNPRAELMAALRRLGLPTALLEPDLSWPDLNLDSGLDLDRYLDPVRSLLGPDSMLQKTLRSMDLDLDLDLNLHLDQVLDPVYSSLLGPDSALRKALRAAASLRERLKPGAAGAAAAAARAAAEVKRALKLQGSALACGCPSTSGDSGGGRQKAATGFTNDTAAAELCGRSLDALFSRAKAVAAMAATADADVESSGGRASSRFGGRRYDRRHDGDCQRKARDGGRRGDACEASTDRRSESVGRGAAAANAGGGLAGSSGHGLSPEDWALEGMSAAVARFRGEVAALRSAVGEVRKRCRAAAEGVRAYRQQLQEH